MPLMSKLFSLHSLTKAQQFCYVQTIICKNLCSFFSPNDVPLQESRREMTQPLGDACFNTKSHVNIWTSVFKRGTSGTQISLMVSLSHGFPPFLKWRDHQNANVLCWEGSGMNSSFTGLYAKFLSTINKIYSLKTFQCSWDTGLLIYNLIWNIFCWFWGRTKDILIKICARRERNQCSCKFLYCLFCSPWLKTEKAGRNLKGEDH